MCTVTVVPHGRGVRLLCNRDERRTRPAALPPAVHDLGGRRAIFPVDPQGGGTWVGVNDAGVIVALLNAQLTRVHDVHRERSRGHVVRELLHCASVPQAIAVAEGLDPRAFDAFRAVIVHDGHVAVVTGDGTSPIRCSRAALDGPLLFTSSSLGDAFVGPPRQRLFDRLVIHGAAGWLGGQARFHQHQWPHRPDISVRMERRDALTVSRTTVDVSGCERRLLYETPVDAAAPNRVREWSWLH